MTEPGDKREFRVTPAMAALIAGGVVILLVVVWFVSGNRNPAQDRLSNPQIEQTAQSDSSKRCSARATYDLVKRELFRRAGESRGDDQPVFAQVAAAAVLRVENPVLEGEENGALNCSGTFYIDLPPGVATAGGQHNLMANLDYMLLPNGAIDLRNPEAITGPLASLQRVAEPLPEPPPNPNAVVPEGNAAASVSASVQPGPPAASAGRPSYDCARAETRGEIAVCNDSGLAALDVNMTTQFRRALTTASPAQLRLLQETRGRFLAYRDRCPNRQCIADAYVGRMREIRDIMEGRLTPAR